LLFFPYFLSPLVLYILEHEIQLSFYYSIPAVRILLEILAAGMLYSTNNLQKDKNI